MAPFDVARRNKRADIQKKRGKHKVHFKDSSYLDGAFPGRDLSFSRKLVRPLLAALLPQAATRQRIPNWLNTRRTEPRKVREGRRPEQDTRQNITAVLERRVHALWIKLGQDSTPHMQGAHLKEGNNLSSYFFFLSSNLTEQVGGGGGGDALVRA